MEKQLHAAIGAKHRTSINGDSTEKDRTPSIHSQFLSLENFRKRLRSLEEMEGATKCAKSLKQLQVTGIRSPEETVAPTTQRL